MKKIIFLLLFSSPIYLSAKQVPGYMGKRFSISYENLILPRSGIAFNIKPGINISHCAEINFVTDYRHAICFTFGYTPLQINNQGANYQSTHNSQVFILDESDKFERLNSLFYSIGIKSFKRSLFAPCGPYVKWELLYFQNNLNVKGYKVNQYYTYNSDSLISTTSYPAHLIKSMSFGVSFGFGRQRIFCNKIIVDYGLRAAVLVSPYFYLSYNRPTYYESKMADDIGRTVALEQSINLRIGIGFLAF